MKKTFLASFLLLSSLAYSKEIFFNGSFIHSINNRTFKAGSLAVGIPFYHFKNPTYFLTADPFISIGEGAVDVGAMVTLVKRFNLNEKWFMDFGISFGMMNLDNQKVHQSQGFNFTERAGIAIAYRTSEISSLALTSGISHISNAGITPRNPGVDSYSLGLRYSYDF